VRCVCDTNVLISALVFPGGAPDQVVERARFGDFRNLSSPDLLSELRRVLTEKFRYTGDEAEVFVARVTAISELVYPTRRLSVVVRKEADNRVLEVAVEGRADLIVTGDRRDLLPLETYEGIRLVTPREALALLAEQDPR
jgi:uncharacterized protein